MHSSARPAATFNNHSAVADRRFDTPSTSDYDPAHREARQFYRDALVALVDGDVPFLVGGAYAFARFTGIKRPTKDFDIFVRPDELERAFAVLDAAGFETEATFPHWLAKVSRDAHFLDIIFSSGNGIARVDDAWFAHGVPGEVFALRVLLAPPEEMIWSKAFVQERERYDGADVIHLLHARGPHLDWPRLRARFADKWRVLLSYLVLYGFVYPGDPLPCPRPLMDELVDALRHELDTPASREKLCQGTILSREQYLVDTLERGYFDGRQEPRGRLTSEDLKSWTAAISERA